MLGIDAPANTRALAGVDPVADPARGPARHPIQELRLGKRWCGTLWPTPALAQQAGMSEPDYAAFVRRALFLDRDDPLAAWGALSDHQAGLVSGWPRRARSGSRPRAPTCACASTAARGSTPTAGATCRVARSSPDRSRTRPTGRSASPCPRARAASRSAAWSSRSWTGRSPTTAPSAATTTSAPRSRPTRARASWVRSGSAPTPGSTAPPARSCSTRRSPGPSTWRSAAPIRRPAGATARRCTGT